jgi:hypothetical protein
MVSARTRPSKRLWGTLTRVERWGLSRRGWLVFISLGAAVIYVAFLNVHPFLAVTQRVDANVLVVEGWIQQYAIRAASDEFNNGSYEHIFTTGGPEAGSGGYVNDYNTSASIGAEALKKLGIPSDAIQMVSSRVIGRDRTYSSATALRDWFHEHDLAVPRMNVLTEDCHARRTQLLYQKALGKNAKVGIIAVSNPDYNPRYWWRFSDGVREVIGESIAYIYARLFFHPSQSSPAEKTAKAPQDSANQ